MAVESDKRAAVTLLATGFPEGAELASSGALRGVRGRDSGTAHKVRFRCMMGPIRKSTMAHNCFGFMRLLLVLASWINTPISEESDKWECYYAAIIGVVSNARRWP